MSTPTVDIPSEAPSTRYASYSALADVADIQDAVTPDDDASAYLFVEELNATYRWGADDDSAIDDVDVLGVDGSAEGRWLRVMNAPLRVRRYIDVDTSPFGADMLVMDNIDEAAPDGDGTRCAFKLMQRYDTSSGPDQNGRQNVQLHLCYNINKATGGRDVLTEPAVSWTIESHVQGENPDDPEGPTIDYVEAGLIFWGIDGSQQRPFYVTARSDNAVGGLGFKAAHYNFTSGRSDATEDDTLFHVAASPTAGALVGVGRQCNGNVNFHVKGKATLFQSDLATSTANGKRWRTVAGGAAGSGDNLAIQIIDDAEQPTLAKTVAEVKRSGMNLSGIRLTDLNLPVYADNAAALVGLLVAGDVYRTAAGVLGIVYTP